MKKYLLLFFAFAVTASAEARPVSYPGGWTVQSMTMLDMSSLNVHYTTDKFNSVGYLGEYWSDEDWQFNGISWNHIVKRWNFPNAQANFYIKSGAGVAHSDYQGLDNKNEASGFTGIALDAEDRRFMAMYENRAMYAGDIDKFYEQSAMFGVAPYIGDYGDLHTWFMVEVSHKPKNEDTIVVTPMIRLFKDANLVEAGVSDNGEIMLNYIHRF